MAYSASFSFGVFDTGLTLAGQILDSDGSNNGSEITNVLEFGGGYYGRVVTTIPDSHIGFVKFYESGSPSSPLAVFAIGPRELENADVAVSTRSDFDETADSVTLTAAGIQAIFDATLTEGYAADGAAFTLAQALYEIVQFHNERNVSSTTVTVKKRDGSTTAYTLTLNDATTPTSITRAT